jgi:hypothetical protein
VLKGHTKVSSSFLLCFLCDSVASNKRMCCIH